MASTRALLITVLLALLSSTVIAEETIHVLQHGETIYTLSRRYGVSADAILSFNHIADPTRLAVGTKIRIPGTYVVQPGDYVYSIARRLGVDWLELLAANGLDRNDVVRPGDTLVIPGTAAASVATTNGTTTGTSATGESGPTSVPPARTGTTAAGGATSPQTGNSAGRTAVTGTGAAVAVSSTTIGTDEWPHPGTREKWTGKFPGVVMHGSVGDEFHSVTTGVVEYVGPFSSFGKLVLVKGANGYLYGYAGADRVDVAKGQPVGVGTTLGTVGFSSAFDSAMVLFTVWRNNRYVDPETAPRG